MALLKLVGEFGKHAGDKIETVDLCDALKLVIYHETFNCQRGAEQFFQAAIAMKGGEA